MVDGALERRDEGASNAFEFIKKYSKLRKCETIYYRNVDFKRAIFFNGDRTMTTLLQYALLTTFRVGLVLSHAYCVIAKEQLR